LNWRIGEIDQEQVPKRLVQEFSIVATTNASRAPSRREGTTAGLSLFHSPSSGTLSRATLLHWPFSYTANGKFFTLSCGYRHVNNCLCITSCSLTKPQHRTPKHYK
jgi:hypothetical protein